MNHWDNTRLISLYYTKVMRPLRKRFDLSQTELAVLMTLASNPTCDTAKDIVRITGYSKSHVSEALAELKYHFLIEENIDNSEHKFIHLQLTHSGKEAVQIIQSVDRDFEQEVFNGFSDSEIDYCKQYLNRILSNVQMHYQK